MPRTYRARTSSGGPTPPPPSTSGTTSSTTSSERDVCPHPNWSARRTVDRSTSTTSPDEGITIVGRLGRITNGLAQFSGSLTNTCALADLKMNRLLDRLDTWAQRTDAAVDPPERFRPTRVFAPPARGGPTASRASRPCCSATGFQPDYPWLDLPVLDRRGRIVHDGGVITGAPGCYVVGLNILRRRRSSYISGAEREQRRHRRLLILMGWYGRPGRLPSGLVTFVFTDIEASTQLLRRIGDRYPPLLERHREILRAAWTAWGGVRGEDGRRLVLRGVRGCDGRHRGVRGGAA